jgi:GNAT superfamily N-acetyltransferase
MTNCEANGISSVCEVTRAFSILRKIKSFLLFTTTHRFVVLPLKTVRKSQARISVTILRHDLDHTCSPEVLHRIKGKAKDWKDRWERGDLCYVAYADGEPIAHIWICHSEWRLKDEDKGSPLPSLSAFLYDAKTREKWRGQGVYQALISMSVTELTSKRYKNLYMLADDRNLPAQHAPAKLGFRRTEHYIRLHRFLKVLNYRRDVVSLLDGC